MRRLLAVLAILLAVPAAAADYPQPQEGGWVARDFKFHTGEVMSELKLHYRTIGDPRNPAVLMLHGTTGSGASVLTPGLAGELFGAGQPLDASKYFIVLPDAIGHGKSSKPSDGLRTRFPKYNYADMVDAHYRLLSEGLGIKRLRLVMGNSMGGMHAWLWAGKYPDYMDAAVPMASQPTPMSARNWMMRRLIIDSIKSDADWNGGDYTSQPKSVQRAAVFYSIATSGGTLAWTKLAPTREAADKLLDQREPACCRALMPCF
jgi:homoserine O-acetyltransferase/O-succinyltransferase